MTEYLGCYNSYTGTGRWDALDFQVEGTGDQETMTPQLCAAKCFNKGFTAPTDMAAVEFGFQCFCGSGQSSTNPPIASKVPDADCQQNSCPGDSTQDCGGGWRFMIQFLLFPQLVKGVVICALGLVCSSTTAQLTPIQPAARSKAVWAATRMR